jgi:hypothetical protein
MNAILDPDEDGFEAQLRRSAAQRSAALGPLIALAGLLREYRLLAERLHSATALLPFELEMTDLRLRQAFGERWWDRAFEAEREGAERDERS